MDYLSASYTKGGFFFLAYLSIQQSCLEVIKLEYSLRLKIKSNDWLLVDTQIIKLEYSLRLKIKCNDWLLVDTQVIKLEYSLRPQNEAQ